MHVYLKIMTYKIKLNESNEDIIYFNILPNFALLTHNLSYYPISVTLKKIHVNLGIHMHGMYEKLSSATW